MAIGGVAVFIFGFHTMSSGLEKVAGNTMEQALSKMTNNLYKGIMLGTLITAVTQSSGAVTILVVGLVNAGILSLRGASGVIMGANIGTCFTAYIVSLGDLDKTGTTSFLIELCKIDSLAPMVAVIGVIMLFASKTNKNKIVGEIFLGLAVLFYGLMTLTGCVKQFAEFPIFEEIFIKMQNPVLGILSGTILTFMIQSSTAATLILQSAATTGLVAFSAAFPLIMGFNIGTTFTSLISAAGATKNAKRAAMMHIWFNVVGVVVIFVGMEIAQALFRFGFWNEPVRMVDIANFGLWFNILNVVVFLPFPKFLEWLAVISVPDKKYADVEDGLGTENLLDERFLKSPSIAIQQASNTALTMGKLAAENFKDSISVYSNFNSKTIEKITAREDIIDKTEDRLGDYLVKVSNTQLTDIENRTVASIMRLLSDFERIGDYAENIMERAEYMSDNKLEFSPEALADLKHFSSAVEEIIALSLTSVEYDDLDSILKIEPLEETIDMLSDIIREKHIERLRSGACSIDRGLQFLDNITDMERIADHCSNIAVYVLAKASGKDSVSRHEYVEKLHKSDIPEYIAATEEYYNKNVTVKGTPSP
jgi:phosphate:Na+ symporter